MSDTWLQACVPGARTVGNVKLKPFTVGHALLLERIGVDIVLTRQDFHAFVGICSRNYEQASKWLEWYLSPVGQWFYRRKPIFCNITEAITQAIDYLVQNKQLPEVMQNEDSNLTGNKYGTPDLQAARTIAISKLNYDPQTINDAPLGQLYWDILSNNELNGGARIIEGEFAQGLQELQRLADLRKAQES